MHNFENRPSRSHIYYGDDNQQNETLTIPRKHIRSGKSLIQFSGHSKRSSSSRGFTRLRAPQIIGNTTTKKLSKSSSCKSSRLKLTKSQQSLRSSHSSRQCCRIKTQLKVVGVGPIDVTRAVSRYRKEKSHFQNVRNSITAEELSVEKSASPLHNWSMEDTGQQAPTQILISPPELTQRSSSRHNFDPQNREQAFYPINSNSDIDGWDLQHEKPMMRQVSLQDPKTHPNEGTGTFGVAARKAHVSWNNFTRVDTTHLKSTLPSNRPETSTTQGRSNNIDRTIPINQSIMNDINILSANQTISQGDMNGSYDQHNIEYNPMTFQNSIAHSHDPEPLQQRQSVTNLIVNQVGPQVHKELAMFFMDRQRALQKLFNPDHIHSRIDDIIEKDLLVKKLLSDQELDATVAFSRLSQLIKQFIDFGQEMKIEQLKRDLINSREQSQANNDKKQAIINDQFQQISNLQSSLNSMQTQQGSEKLKQSLKTKKLLEVQDQQIAQIEFLKRETEILKENFEIQLESTLKEKLNQNLENYRARIDDQNEQMKNEFNDTQKRINLQLIRKEQELLNLEEKIETVKQEMRKKHNKTVDELRDKYESEIDDLKNMNMTQTNQFQQEFQIFQDQISKYDQSFAQNKSFEKQLNDQRSSFDDQLSIKDNKISSLVRQLDELQKQKNDFEEMLKTHRMSQYSQQETLLSKNQVLKTQAQNMQNQLELLRSQIKQTISQEQNTIIQFGKKMASRIESEVKKKNESYKKQIESQQKEIESLRIKQDSELQEAEAILREIKADYSSKIEQLEHQISISENEKISMQNDFSKKLEIILAQNDRKHRDRRQRDRSKSQDKVSNVRAKCQSQLNFMKQKQLMLEKELHVKSQIEVDLDKSLDFINQQYSQSTLGQSGPFIVHPISSSFSRSRPSGFNIMNSHTSPQPTSPWQRSGKINITTGSSFKRQTTASDSPLRELSNNQRNNKENQFLQQ